MNRAAQLSQLREGPPLDILVVGGGISGAGVALEAARAGARTALVEARDYASGASSRSSKLVHGGLRYLAQGQFRLTRESVRERTALLRDAPGLVTPCEFLLPVRKGDKNGRFKLGLGLAAYDFLAGARSRRWRDPAALLECAPMLSPRDLLGGWSYLDAETDDARLVLRVLNEARRYGALTLNYLAVDAFLRGADGVEGASLSDAASGETFVVAARCIVNATGAWADRTRGKIGLAAKLRPLRGSHLLFAAARLPVAQAIAFFHPDDGRPVFAVPWEGATLLGTTDLDHAEDLDCEPTISPTEVAYLLAATRYAFPALALTAADIVSTFAGVRPVVASHRVVDPSKETREHLILEEGGLVTVTGGKLTTFRSSAIEALKCVATRVPGLDALRGDLPVFAAPSAEARAAVRDLPAPMQARWLAAYGDDAAELRASALPEELTAIAANGATPAELRWAFRAEHVMHLDDALLRRTRFGLLLPNGAEELMLRARDFARQEAGWSDARWEDEAARYRALISRCYSVPRGAS